MTSFESVSPSSEPGHAKVPKATKVILVLGGIVFAGWAMFMMSIGGSSDNRKSCEDAYQEVLQRQTAGRMTDGAVSRLANCK